MSYTLHIIIPHMQFPMHDLLKLATIQLRRSSNDPEQDFLTTSPRRVFLWNATEK